MRVEHTVSAGLFFFAVLAFIVLSCPVSILAQEKPEPLIQPSPVPSSQPAPQQPNNPGNESVLVNTDLISFNVTVTDTYGRFVSGLSKKAFAVYDDKEAEDITFFGVSLWQPPARREWVACPPLNRPVPAASG